MSQGCELHSQDGWGCWVRSGDRTLCFLLLHAFGQSLCFPYPMVLVYSAKLVHRVRVKGNTWVLFKNTNYPETSKIPPDSGEMRGVKPCGEDQSNESQFYCLQISEVLSWPREQNGFGKAPKLANRNPRGRGTRLPGDAVSSCPSIAIAASSAYVIHPRSPGTYLKSKEVDFLIGTRKNISHGNQEECQWEDVRMTYYRRWASVRWFGKASRT